MQQPIKAERERKKAKVSWKENLKQKRKEKKLGKREQEEMFE